MEMCIVLLGVWGVCMFFNSELPCVPCGQVAWRKDQTQDHDPSLSNALAWPSWPAPPLTPCGMFQSAQRQRCL